MKTIKPDPGWVITTTTTTPPPAKGYSGDGDSLSSQEIPQEPDIMNEKGTVTVPTQGHSDRGIQQAQKRKAFPLALTRSEQIKTGPEFNWV